MKFIHPCAGMKSIPGQCHITNRHALQFIVTKHEFLTGNETEETQSWYTDH